MVWVCWTVHNAWALTSLTISLCFLQLKVFSKFTKKNVNYGTMCNGPRPEVLMKLLPIWLDKLVLLERSLLRIQPLRAERPLRRLSWGTNSKYCEWWMGLTLLTIFQRPVLEFDLLYNDRKIRQEAEKQWSNLPKPIHALPSVLSMTFSICFPGKL